MVMLHMKHPGFHQSTVGKSNPTLPETTIPQKRKAIQKRCPALKRTDDSLLVSRDDNPKPVTNRVAQWCSKQTGLALKASMGASGTCDDRLHFTFHEEEQWSIADSLWWEQLEICAFKVKRFQLVQNFEEDRLKRTGTIYSSAYLVRTSPQVPKQ